MKNDEVKNEGLCFRCEHRALFLENGHRPRCECGDIESNKMGCYMYRPVRPVTLGKKSDDPRPVTLNYFSARVYFKKIADVDLTAEVNKNEFTAFYIPKGGKYENGNRATPRRKKGDSKKVSGRVSKHPDNDSGKTNRQG